MRETDYCTEKVNKVINMKEAIKRIVTFVVAFVFMCGCMYIPSSGFASEAYALDENVGDYIDGEVIVSYVDTDDMNLSSRQENKIDRVLGDAQEIITLDSVSLADVTVDESLLTKKVQKNEEVDKTLAVISSETKSTQEMISEIEKLPNVNYAEPNYIFAACEVATEEGEGISATEETAETEEGATESTEPVDGTAGGADEDKNKDENINAIIPTPESAEIKAAIGNFTSYQWAFNNLSYGMNIPDWNNPSNTNAGGTVVAVLDTGVDYYHEDLKGVMWKDGLKYSGLTGIGGGEYGADYYNGDSNPMDDNNHGTHCAGIIAAQWNEIGVSGAANGSRIMAVKAGNSDGLSYAAILDGYRYIIKAKELGVNVVAINNSWGGGAAGTHGLSDLITEAGEKGIVSVFASANDGKDCDVPYRFPLDNDSYFSGYYICYYFKDNPYVITVNSIQSDGNLSYFSNFGLESTDLGAPGSAIFSTVRNNDYNNMQGTSMATPAVTGEVAIVSAEFPNAPADVISSVVTNNTSDNAFLSGKCKSGGQADVDKAINADLKELQYRNFRLTNNEYTYDGSEKKPGVIIRNLQENEDYTVAYQNDPVNAETYPLNAGTYKVIINSLGDYVGSLELLYNINKATPKVSLRSGVYTYDGSTKRNALYVKGVNDASWTSGYQYSLGGRLSAKLPGTYSVTVTPQDSRNYNTVTKTYRIAVKTTSIRGLYRAYKGFKVKVYKQSRSRVTGYQVRYSLNKSMSGAKTKTIGTRYYYVSKTVKYLKRYRTYYVQVRSYKTISGKKYYSTWSNVRSVKTR